jgi:hypothetical protein
MPRRDLEVAVVAEKGAILTRLPIAIAQGLAALANGMSP